MSDIPRHEDLRAVYGELCQSYRAIDDFRTKLLSLLPLVTTGTGIFVLAGDPSKNNETFLLPVGLFGIVITLGLFFYEIHGIKKCGYLISTGERIESAMQVYGQFRTRPHDAAGFINEPFATSVIYPAVLAAWTYLTLSSSQLKPDVGTLPVIIVTIAAFLIPLVLTWCWTDRMEDDLKNSKGRYNKEPYIKKYGA